ncbi:MAG: phosphoglucosamine mutase [Bacteroidota bacterium]
MPLIKSISGMRGTLGGSVGTSLTPVDITHVTAAFGSHICHQASPKRIILGRDARPSGPLISQLVSATLQALGIHVIDLGLSTTPTVAMAIRHVQAQGGIVISASHNPADWNALKLFNQAGEYIEAATAEAIFATAVAQPPYVFANTQAMGTYVATPEYMDMHIERILALPLVDPARIAQRKFFVAVDGINSGGGIFVPKLLKALGVAHSTVLNDEPTGLFAHNPEPLPAHLTTLASTVRQGAYDLGIAVDPDVDRLAIVDENGEAWGEEYTLVAVADYVLRHTPGNTVSNLASTDALGALAAQCGTQHTTSAVGERHVVDKMRATQAVIGGEGSGGVIYPALHYNRDALVGIALLLTHLANLQCPASELKAQLPTYYMLKHKLDISPDLDVPGLFDAIRDVYQAYSIDTRDGVKVRLPEGWLLLRKSNTEPVLRLFVEATTMAHVQNMMRQALQDIQQLTA